MYGIKRGCYRLTELHHGEVGGGRRRILPGRSPPDPMVAPGNRSGFERPLLMSRRLRYS